jgi:hydrogenase expression/formation protein HypC
MDLGIPAKILELSGDIAKVDFGGVTREVNVSMVDVTIDDYVIVQAGFAILKLDTDEALKMLEMFNQLLDSENN